MDERIYLDNAATSWPKPPAVVEAMRHCLDEVGGSPGRSGHRMAIEAGRLLAEARMGLADLLGVDDPSRVVFTKNVTEALNLAIAAHVRPGDHVITTSVEHNSVMRPLRQLESRGAGITTVRCSPRGELDLDELAAALRRPTALVAVTHASNVIGNLLPIGEVTRLAHEHGVPVLVDAAQTAGAVPIDMPDLGIDLLAVTGHKSLLGPTGTGALCLGPGIEPEPLLRGGTGSASELETQPEFLPDSLESGTPNLVGIAGLAAGVDFLLGVGIDEIRRHELTLTGRFLEGVEKLDGVEVYGPGELEQRIGLVSFTVEGVSPSDVGLVLDRRFGVMCRIGLHCAPAAHTTLGTYPTGTVRFAWSIFTTEAEVDVALGALGTVVRERDRLRAAVAVGA